MQRVGRAQASRVRRSATRSDSHAEGGGALKRRVHRVLQGREVPLLVLGVMVAIGCRSPYPNESHHVRVLNSTREPLWLELAVDQPKSGTRDLVGAEIPPDGSIDRWFWVGGEYDPRIEAVALWSDGSRSRLQLPYAYRSAGRVNNWVLVLGPGSRDFFVSREDRAAKR